VNTQVLRYILEVEKTGSISRAADNLFISQPSLSKIIGETEAALGITIFRRTRGGVVLTDKGRELTAIARNILEQVDLLEDLHRSAAPSERLTLYAPAAIYSCRAVTAVKPEKGTDIIYRFDKEASAAQSSSGSIMITRVRQEHADRTRRGLSDSGWTVLCGISFRPLFTASRHHPYAVQQAVDTEQLSACTALMYGREELPMASRVSLPDQLACLTALSRMKEAYALTEPLNPAEITMFKLCQHPIVPQPDAMCDLIAIPSDQPVTALQREIMDHIRHEAAAAGLDITE